MNSIIPLAPAADAPQLPGSPQSQILTHNLTTFQWKDVPEPQRPSSPMDEYVRHQHAISRDILLWRWEGLGVEWDVNLIYNTPYYERWRAQVQAMARTGQELPDITDPKVLQTLAIGDFFAARELYIQQTERMRQELEPDVEVTVDPITGQSIKRNILRPMRAREFKARSDARLQLRTEMQLLSGQATEIVKVTREGNYNEDKRDAAARELDEWRKTQQVNLQVTIQTVGNAQVTLSSPESLPPSPSTPILSS